MSFKRLTPKELADLTKNKNENGLVVSSTEFKLLFSEFKRNLKQLFLSQLNVVVNSVSSSSFRLSLDETCVHYHSGIIHSISVRPWGKNCHLIIPENSANFLLNLLMGGQEEIVPDHKLTDSDLQFLKDRVDCILYSWFENLDGGISFYKNAERFEQIQFRMPQENDLNNYHSFNLKMNIRDKELHLVLCLDESLVNKFSNLKVS
jgi:flagellar motor switch protein FliM